MADTANLVGAVLSDRYELLNKIGTGGMAMVYKAHDRVLDRNVAIKILRQSYESESKIVENFIKEARSSASLVHPNVVSVYDVCEYDGLNYMVMELVDGITLKEYIKQNPRMPWQEACDYAIQIGQGIQAAHERGIIHRDIKPQNIIMAPGGVLKVTDFGIAKAMESDKTIAGGTAMGSVHYISPEQARGGYTDFRSDIYSLGIVLYEMLSGRVPFDGDSPVSVALMHIEEEPVNVKCVNLDVPADLAYITMKAMAREQSKRYQNTNQMLEDLRAVLADETLPSMENERSDFDEEDEPEAASTKKPIKDDDLISRGRNTRTKNNLKKKSRKKQKERNAVVLALSTVAAMILIAAGVIIIMLKPFSNTVPDFTNLLITEAETLAKKSGYKEDFVIEYSISDAVEEDRVITQFPEPGTEASHMTQITLVVSVGSSGGNIEVPDLTELTIEEAMANIESLSLICNSISEYNDEVEAGYIIRQTPIGGTMLNAGDTVTVHYSLGDFPGGESKTKVSVPELSGYTQDRVQTILSSYGLTLGSVTKRTSPKPEGVVITQSPASGTEVEEGTAISIIISSGSYVAPEPVQEDPPAENGENSDPAENTPQETERNEAKVNMYTVRIPADAQNDAVNVQVVAEGVVVHDAVHRKSEGQVTVEIPYSGSVSIQAYIDGAKISDKTVNF